LIEADADHSVAVHGPVFPASALCCQVPWPRQDGGGPAGCLPHTRMHIAALPPRIGLDLLGAGISTNSARGPETTGNNRHVSDNADTETGYPTPESADPPSVHRIRKPAGQATGPAAP
jgi:hypothetical protein